MLIIENAIVRYGGITAVNNISIKVEEGETVLLIGANGAGKSTIINAVIGLVPLSHGNIMLSDKSLEGFSADRRARAGIGYSPEGRQLFPRLSVRDNVLTGAFGRGASYQRETFDWLASMFPLLAERANHPAGQLSGGQQQVVALARALSASPKLLLLDEPFLGLAPIWIEQISRAIRSVQQRGMTLLMTEQMARPALRLAMRGYVLRGGEVRREGTVAQIKEIALAEEYL